MHHFGFVFLSEQTTPRVRFDGHPGIPTYTSPVAGFSKVTVSRKDLSLARVPSQSAFQAYFAGPLHEFRSMPFAK